jgi:enamine deaminase RidA (YjgF/YER057c/UK114 family)
MSASGEAMSAETNLEKWGITLPAAPKPLGAYVEAVRAGDLLFLSGALPIEDGEPRFIGRIGNELTAEDGRKAARLATLNALALARSRLGSLDKVVRVVRLAVSLATTEDFRAHPKVADAASELLDDVFGSDKASTRMIYGVHSLPAGVCAIVELVLLIEAAT